MKTDLLWVYEGLTEYYGSVLGARSGLWSVKEYRGHLASVAASLDHRPGRKWRPARIQRTSRRSSTTRDSAGHGRPRRREVDFATKGMLIWLEADVLIRSQTGGKKSLDDFANSFTAGGIGLAAVNPYTFDEVVKTMNAVSAHDWKAFFTERLTATGPHAPLGGITESGWKLEYTDKRTNTSPPRGFEEADRPQLFPRTVAEGRWGSAGRDAGHVRV